MSEVSVQYLASVTQAHAPRSPLSAAVLPFQMRATLRQPSIAASNKHARELQEANWLALQVHLSDIRLGRCADVPYHALSDAEREEKQLRALMWVRLGDSAVVDTASEHAAQAIAAEHSLATSFLPTVRAVAQTAQRVFIEHLQAFRGARA